MSLTVLADRARPLLRASGGGPRAGWHRAAHRDVRGSEWILDDPSSGEVPPA